MDSDATLFDEFPAVSSEAWEARIKKDLRGADYKTKLKWHTGEGIEALPFYRSEDVDEPSSLFLSEHSDWELRQPVGEQDISKAHKIARHAIKNGADALAFILNPLTKEGSLQGVAIQNQQAFSRLIEGIDITTRAIHFDAGPASPIILAMLHNEMEAQNLDPDAVLGSVLFDPYAFALTHGRLPNEMAVLINDLKQMVDFCDKNMPGIRSLGVDARVYHQSGGTIVQEVAYALAVASEYLAGLSGEGLSTDIIASAMHFNFAVGSNYFLEMAKFRAVRKLWNTLLEAYGVKDDPPAYLHSCSSTWNKTIYDPYINMLRTTTEGMSAAVAGCDAITLYPFDETFRQPDDFSRRMAGNIQIILKEEAYFNKVADPAAGSYYIEMLTDKIAKAAWKEFQKIEQQKGFLKAIYNGYIQNEIETSRKEKDQAIATRKRVLVGINQYPNAAGDSPEEQEIEEAVILLKETGQKADINKSQLMPSLKKALKDGCALGDLLPALYNFKKLDIPVIRRYRGAEAFEELRRATEHHATTPNVLIVAMGDKKMRKARSAFAINFFGCAGYDIENPVGFESAGEAAKKINQEKPDIVVLCSSDEEYKTLVPEFCDAVRPLKQNPLVVLAGYPKEEMENFKKAGIDAFIHAKSNVLETLTDFQMKLGIIEN